MQIFWTSGQLDGAVRTILNLVSGISQTSKAYKIFNEMVEKAILIYTFKHVPLGKEYLEKYSELSQIL